MKLFLMIRIWPLRRSRQKHVAPIFDYYRFLAHRRGRYYGAFGTAHEITSPTICMAVLACRAVTSQVRRGINARNRGSRNHSPLHAVTPRMRLTIISGVSVPATRRWLVIAPPRNPVRMIAPSTLVVGIA